jgi:hypothetical protein
MGFVTIPAGSFMMGCSPGDPECYAEEKPAHRVVIAQGFDYGLSCCPAEDSQSLGQSRILVGIKRMTHLAKA